MQMPGTIGSATIVFAEPTIVKGSHLTVSTWPDGKTELKWDDEALQRDVQNAIATVTEKPKRNKKGKTNG